MRRGFHRVGYWSLISFVSYFGLSLYTVAPAFADEPVEVRFGIHRDFDRIVFDWDDDVAFDVNREGEAVVITFSRLATFDVLTAPEDFGDRLLSTERRDQPSTTFRLNAASNVGLSTLDYDDGAGGYKVIIDVVDGPEPAAQPQRVAATKPDAPGELLTPEQRYEAAFEAMLADPSNPEIALDFTKAASEVGDVRGAIAALERILLVKPDLDNIKMELGLLYQRVGANELAQSYLGKVVNSEDMPETVEDRAQSALEEADTKVAAERTRHRFSGSLFLGGRYDTNANAGPGSKDIRLFGFEGPFLNDEDTEQEDVSALAIGNLNYAFDFGTQAGHALEAGLFGLGSRYKDETDVNTSLIDGDIGPRFFLGNPIAPAASIRPFATSSYLELDDEKYRVAVGGGLNTRTGFGPVGADVTLRSVFQEFYDTGERPAASDQTGWYSTLRPSALIEPIKGTVLGVGLIAGLNNADEDFESFIEFGANVFVSQSFMSGPFTAKPMSTTLRGSYRRTEYDDPDIQVDPDNEREDDRYDISLSLDIPIIDHLALSLSGQQTWNESNLPNNEYDNTAGTAGFTFDF